MATLANRDWYIANTNGQPLKVRCLSVNYVLGTARVVTMDGDYGEVDAHALKHTPEEILALDLRDETDDPTRFTYREGDKIVVEEGGQQVAEWEVN